MNVRSSALGSSARLRTHFIEARLITAAAALFIVAAPAAAQNEQDRPCAVLCAPELKIEPTFTIEHLAQRHRIEVDGEVERVPRETVFELVLFRHVKSLGPGTQPPPLARLNGVVSLVLWVTVIVCGRMITFYRPNVCQPGQALGVLANCIVR